MREFVIEEAGLFTIVPNPTRVWITEIWVVIFSDGTELPIIFN